jgi:hypothetical protein
MWEHTRNARVPIFVEDSYIKEGWDEMSKSRIFWIVLITVVIIAALAGGGYALYRYGYARGMAAEVGEFLRGRLSGELGEGEWIELGEHSMPWGRHMGFMPRSRWFGHMPGFWGGGLIGLVLGGGILALAVYGAISLVRRNRATAEELESKTKK